MGGGKNDGVNILVLHDADLSGLVSAWGCMANTSVAQRLPGYAVVHSWYAGKTSDCAQHHVQRRPEVHESPNAEEAGGLTYPRQTSDVLLQVHVDSDLGQ